MTETKQLTFWRSQQEFFTAGPQPTLFLGGVGAGKSFIGILKMLALLDQYPGSRGVIVRQKFNQLKKTTAATLWKLLPKDRIARRNDNDGTLRLTNGSELLLMHLDQPGSIAGMKSLEVNFAYVDQLEDLSSEAWDTLYERVGRWTGASMRGGWPTNWPYVDRLGNKIPPRYIFASAYSPGYDHWITARWWEHGNERERYAAQGYKVIMGSTRDNLALSQEYIDGRIAMGPEYVRRYVDAVDWGANEGRIFEIDEQSIVEATPELLDRIKRTMRLHRVYDHGEAIPSAMLWYATNSNGDVFVYREYMQEGLTVSQHRRLIYDLSKEDSPNGLVPPPYYSNLADPAIFHKTRGKTPNSKAQWSVSDEFMDKRIVDAETAIYFRPALNDEAATINRVREYLRVDGRHFNPFTGKRGAPRVYFLKKSAKYPHGCHEVLVDIRSAKREEVGSKADGTKLFGDKRDETVRDHLLDCFAGDTLVDTPDGQCRIDSLPRNGVVWSPVGWVDYTDCLRYNSSRLVRIEFASGRAITCTPDHRLLSSKGWVEAQHSLQSQILSLSPTPCRSSWESDMLSAVSTFSAVGVQARDAFIEWSGRRITALYQKARTFTTQTITASITRLATWFSSLLPSTRVTITPENLTFRGMPLTPPQSGIGRQPAGDGMPSTLDTWWRSDASRIKAYVSSVGGITGRFAWLLNVLNSVLQRAERLTFDSVIRVTPAGTGDVYCLTVQHPLHAFSVGGGLAVSNCLRYLLIMRPARGLAPDRPAPEAGTIRIDDYYRMTDAEHSREAIRARREFRGSSYGY